MMIPFALFRFRTVADKNKAIKDITSAEDAVSRNFDEVKWLCYRLREDNLVNMNYFFVVITETQKRNG